MRGKLVALIVGLLVGSTGTAIGAAAVWYRSAPSYICRGFQQAAWCKLRRTPYEAFVTRGQISIVDTRYKDVIFGCSPGFDPLNDCNDFR
jgi:hypothetical protein